MNNTKLFIGDELNFRFASDRKNGTIIGFTEDNRPLVTLEKTGINFLLEHDKLEDAVLLNKSVTHLTWEVAQDIKYRNACPPDESSEPSKKRNWFKRLLRIK